MIDLGLCPFAQVELDADRIRFSVPDSGDLNDVLVHLIMECRLLDRDESIETTLVILPDGFSEFDDYLALVDLAAGLLIQHGYEGTYQLASFHPAYVFADVPASDPANYTNRSPYPMLHLLRERGVELALARYPKPERIPERNIERTRRLGGAALRALLDACYKD